MQWYDFVQMAKRLCNDVRMLLKKSRYNFEVVETANCNLEIKLYQFYSKDNSKGIKQSDWYLVNACTITQTDNKWEDNLKKIENAFCNLLINRK